MPLYNDPAALQKATEQFEKDGSGPLAVMYNLLLVGFFKNDKLLDSKEFQSLPTEMKEHLKRPTVPTFELCCGLPPVLPGVNPEHTYIT